MTLVAMLVCWFGRFVKERSIDDDVRELPQKKLSVPELSLERNPTHVSSAQPPVIQH